MYSIGQIYRLRIKVLTVKDATILGILEVGAYSIYMELTTCGIAKR